MHEITIETKDRALLHRIAELAELYGGEVKKMDDKVDLAHGFRCYKLPKSSCNQEFLNKIDEVLKT